MAWCPYIFFLFLSQIRNRLSKLSRCDTRVSYDTSKQTVYICETSRNECILDDIRRDLQTDKKKKKEIGKKNTSVIFPKRQNQLYTRVCACVCEKSVKYTLKYLVREKISISICRTREGSTHRHRLVFTYHKMYSLHISSQSVSTSINIHCAQQ